MPFLCSDVALDYHFFEQIVLLFRADHILEQLRNPILCISALALKVGVLAHSPLTSSREGMRSFLIIGVEFPLKVG